MENALSNKRLKKLFIEKLKEGDFREYSNGTKTIELQNVVLKPESDFILREPNYDYARREIEWYKSMSLNVNDIPGSVPMIWQSVSDDEGFINSNYGWCIYSKENGEQFDNCIKALETEMCTRNAVMIYTRPSMHTDFSTNGMHDFMCTHYVHCFLNKDRQTGKITLKYIIYQRSCDAVFGFNNDYQWHKHVYSEMVSKLKEKYPSIDSGNEDITFNFGSIHVYERHFKYLTD